MPSIPVGSYPFRKHEVSDDRCMIKFFAEKDASWEEINTWLKTNYKDGKSFRWDWRGFGTIGTDDYYVCLIKKSR